MDGAIENFERRIEGRVRDFDLVMLVQLLCQHGMRREAISFRSHPTTERRATEVQNIEFSSISAFNETTSDTPNEQGVLHDRSAQIEVNVGLRSCSSRLPTYFRDLMFDPNVNEALGTMLDAVDDAMIRQRVESQSPEFVVKGWDRLRDDARSCLGFSSLAVVDWVFRKAFPELQSSVERKRVLVPVPGARPRLGSTPIGVAAFGGVSNRKRMGFAVTLVSEESICESGVSWAVEAKARVESVIRPNLMSLEVGWEIDLLLLDSTDKLSFDQVSMLGYAPLVESSNAPRRVRLHSGLFGTGDLRS